MKTITCFCCLLLSLSFFSGCSKEKDDAVWINFINTTQADISQAKVQEITLGTISKKGQTDYRKFEDFGTNSNIPVLSFYGYINGQYVESFPLRCGNGTNSLPPGKYDILVETVSSGSVTYFNLILK